MKVLRVLFAAAKAMPWLFAVNLLLWAAFHTLPTVFGIAVGDVFDGLNQGDQDMVVAALWLFGAVVAGRVISFEAGVVAYTTLWHKWLLLLRRNLLRWLMTAPGSRVMPVSTGAAVSTFREDVDELGTYVEHWVDVGGLVLFVGSALAVLFTIDSRLAILVVIPLLVAAGFTQSMSSRIRSYRERMRMATEQVTGFIGDLFTSIETVKAAGTQESMLGHLASVNSTREKAALRDTLLEEMVRSVNRNMSNIATGLVLLAGAASLRDGVLSVGELATFLVYIPRLTGYMAWFGEMIAQHNRTRVAFDRMLRLAVDAEPETLLATDPLELDGRGDPPAPLDLAPSDRLRSLRVEGLSFQFEDGDHSISDVTFEVPRGSFTVITGRVGAGKSTLIRVMLGLLPADSGTVSWNDEPIADPASFLVPPRSAYTPQVPRLVSASLRANITMGRSLDSSDLAEVLDLARLDQDLDHLESGLETVVGTRGVRLSGGQVQRSAAARMFATDADLLVFDDLSSALDVRTEAELWKRLFELRDVTCLVVSHRRPALQRADQIILMQGGRVADVGRLDDLLSRSEEMRALWEETD